MGVVENEKSLRRMCKKLRKDFSNFQHSLTVLKCTLKCTFDHVFAIEYLLENMHFFVILIYLFSEVLLKAIK